MVSPAPVQAPHPGADVLHELLGEDEVILEVPQGSMPSLRKKPVTYQGFTGTGWVPSGLWGLARLAVFQLPAVIQR